MLDAGVELIGGNVLSRYRAGLGPVAAKGKSKRQILPHTGIGALLARRGLEHGQRIRRLTSKREREPVIGRIEHRLAGVEEGHRLVILAERDLDQRELEHDLGLVGINGERVLVRRFRRPEAAAGEVGVAEQRAESRVVRGLFDRPLGEADRHWNVVGIEGQERTGREPHVAICPDRRSPVPWEPRSRRSS